MTGDGTMLCMTEYWRQSSFEGLQISDAGRLRDPMTGRIIELKAYASKQGGTSYARFRHRYIHQMVLEAFVGPCPPGGQCRHLNGDSLDNRLENLAWGTASEDNRDRVRHGTHQHSNRTHCKHGHLLDGWNGKQRFCTECHRIRHRKRRAAKETCPRGHPFDGVRYNADGTVRQRYCTTCVKQQLVGGRKGRNFEAKTHCKRGHPLDGVHYRADGSVKQRFCKTCKRERKRAIKEAKAPQAVSRAAGAIPGDGQSPGAALT